MGGNTRFSAYMRLRLAKNAPFEWPKAFNAPLNVQTRFFHQLRWMSSKSRLAPSGGHRPQPQIALYGLMWNIIVKRVAGYRPDGGGQWERWPEWLLGRGANSTTVTVSEWRWQPKNDAWWLSNGSASVGKKVAIGLRNDFMKACCSNLWATLWWWRPYKALSCANPLS